MAQARTSAEADKTHTHKERHDKRKQDGKIDSQCPLDFRDGQLNTREQ